MENKEAPDTTQDTKQSASSADDEQCLRTRVSAFTKRLQAYTQGKSEKGSAYSNVQKKKSSSNKDQEEGGDLISTLVARSKELGGSSGSRDRTFDAVPRESVEQKSSNESEKPLTTPKLADSIDSFEEFPKKRKRSSFYDRNFLAQNYFTRHRKSKINKWQDFVGELKDRESHFVGPISTGPPTRSPITSVQRQQANAPQDSLPGEPTRVYCVNCEKFVLTVVKYEVGIFSYVSAVLFLIVFPFLIVCVCVPFFVPFFKDKKHFCPVCGELLGTLSHC